MFTKKSEATFWFDGISSAELGMRVSGFPEFTAAAPRVTKYSIPGRNGDLTYWDGSFENVEGEISGFILDAVSVDPALTAVNNWLTDCGYKELAVSSEPGRYRMARITNAAEIAVRMGVLAPFTIKFDCKPQRFYADETPIQFSGTGGEIVNNTGFEAFPRLRFNLVSGTTYAPYPSVRFGNKDGDFRLIVTPTGLSGAEWIEIDLEKRSATRDDGTNLNITTDSSGFPSFCAGTTKVYDAEWAESIEVFPRWWSL